MARARGPEIKRHATGTARAPTAVRYLAATSLCSKLPDVMSTLRSLHSFGLVQKSCSEPKVGRQGMSTLPTCMQDLTRDGMKGTGLQVRWATLIPGMRANHGARVVVSVTGTVEDGDSSTKPIRSLSARDGLKNPKIKI